MFNNVSQLLELRALRNRFEKNHPKFFPFMKAAKTRALEEGSLIEISVTPPDGEMVSTNLKVQASDLELLQEADGGSQPEPIRGFSLLESGRKKLQGEHQDCSTLMVSPCRF